MHRTRRNTKLFSLRRQALGKAANTSVILEVLSGTSSIFRPFCLYWKSRFLIRLSDILCKWPNHFFRQLESAAPSSLKSLLSLWYVVLHSATALCIFAYVEQLEPEKRNIGMALSCCIDFSEVCFSYFPSSVRFIIIQNWWNTLSLTLKKRRQILRDTFSFRRDGTCTALTGGPRDSWWQLQGLACSLSSTLHAFENSITFHQSFLFLNEFL